MGATLNRDEFKAWVESKKPGEIVGVREESTECPIACYLKEGLGFKGPSIDKEAFMDLDFPDMEAIPTPYWAEQFIERVDEKRDFYDYPVVRPGVENLDDAEEIAEWEFRVDREEALHVLDKISETEPVTIDEAVVDQVLDEYEAWLKSEETGVKK
jgi:hypothetical protein